MISKKKKSAVIRNPEKVDGIPDQNRSRHRGILYIHVNQVVVGWGLFVVCL